MVMQIERTYTGDTDKALEEQLAKEKAEWKAQGYYVSSGDLGKVGTDDVGKVVLNIFTVTDFLLGIGKQSAEAQDSLFNEEFKGQVAQLQALKDLNTVLEAVNNAKANGGQLGDTDKKMIQKLKTDGKITYDDTWDLSKLDAEKLETLRGQLTTAQSSQSATNEEASMRLNEAANARSAIFTQLNTLLQTLMQTNQNLARW